MKSNALPLVSVIMPVYNEASFIRESLGAVLAQDYPADKLEILVVDGGSTDNTCQPVREMLADSGRGRLLQNPRKIQAAALNIGISAAQGDIIVRVDGHTIIAPDYVSACVSYLVQNKADNVGGLMRPLGTTRVGRSIALATTSPFGIGGSKFHYSEREQYVDTVYLGAFWRKTFDRIGLYDETVNINEDYELNIRLRKAGGKILLSPRIKSYYFPRASLPALWTQYFVYGRQKTLTLQKHPASLQWRQAIPPLFVFGFVFTLMLGFVWQPARYLFAAIAGSYLLANMVASTIAARRGGWQYLPVLPLVFASIHFVWGLGFWAGWIKWLFQAKR